MLRHSDDGELRIYEECWQAVSSYRLLRYAYIISRLTQSNGYSRTWKKTITSKLTIGEWQYPERVRRVLMKQDL